MKSTISTNAYSFRFSYTCRCIKRLYFSSIESSYSSSFFSPLKVDNTTDCEGNTISNKKAAEKVESSENVVKKVTAVDLVSNSLAEATRHGKRCKSLNLSKSEDLVCKNIMCEKLGEACICRLARCLSFTPNVVDIDLSNNGLTNLPDTIYTLENLEKIDLKGNSFSKEERESIKERLHEMKKELEKSKLVVNI